MSKSDSGAAFKEAYASLNAAQKEAVDSIEGPVMVIAGPGTGKTTMLTLRIAKILQVTDVSPENILALTFTNSGVQAMRQKLREYIHDDAYRVGIFTFHSFAEHVLTRHASYFPEYEYARVIDDLEKVQIIEHILSTGSFSSIVSLHDPFSSLKQVKSAIDEIKKEGLTPKDFLARIPDWEKRMMSDDSMFYKRKFGEYKAGDLKPAEVKKVEGYVAKAKEIALVFDAYQQELAKRGRYDFTDMIIAVIERLQENQELKLELQEQYQYLLVDEHQDTNDGQNRLIQYLTDAEHLNKRPNLFTVGDEKQSIYRFQGASAESFTHLQSQYEDVKIIELEENYRSTEAVLTASHELIERTVPSAKNLKSNSTHKKPVSIAEFSDYKFELLYVVHDIQRHITAGVDPKEIAVIYRSNKHLRELKTLLHDANIPYRVLSKDTLLDDQSIEMFVTFLRVIAQPLENAQLGKLLFADFLSISALHATETLRNYFETTRTANNRKSLLEYLKEDEEFAQLISAIDKLKTFEANHSFTDFFKEVLHESGFLQHVLKSADSQTGLRKIDTLFSEVKRQSDENRTYSLEDFIRFVDAEKKYQLDIEVTPSGRTNGIGCLTAHKSKGLEFAHVYLINVSRSNWEKSRGFGSIKLPIEGYVGDLDDERRLFYVAMTRAKTHLTISSSAMDWHGKLLEPSQFISELAESAVEKIPTAAFETEHASSLTAFLSNSEEAHSVFEPEYLAELFLRENLSVTALNNYLDCPIKYLFRNLIHLPDVYTTPQRYGDVLHRTLEKFFKEAVGEKKIGTMKTLLSHLTEAIHTSGFSSVEQDKYLAQGTASLTAYFEKYHKKWNTDVSVEEYIKRSLMLSNEREITISGRIDKIEFIDGGTAGRVRVVDYKTGKSYSEKSREQKDKLDRQLVFYHLLLRSYRDGLYEVEEAVLDFVEPNKKGELEQKTIAVTESDIDALVGSIQEMVTAVTSGTFLKLGCRKKDCEHCAFYSQLH